MANYTHTLTADPGLSLYAFDQAGSLANWSASRIAYTEAASPNGGRYTATLDDTVSYAVFVGPGQPTGFGEAIRTVATITATGGGLTAAEATQLTTLVARPAPLDATATRGAAAEAITNTIEPDVSTLTSRLTAARAGKLDSLLATGTVAAAGSTATNLDQVSGGGATGAAFPTDVEDADVPAARTAVMLRSGAALRSREPLYLRVGESGANAALCAASFRHDVSVGGRVGEVVSAAVEGSPTGLTIDAVSAWKRDKQEVRFLPSAIAAGSYTIRVAVRYADGSGAAVGLIDVVVEG